MADPLPVVVAGHLCLDLIPGLGHVPAGQFESLFAPGRLIRTGPMSISTGGPVSNTGLSLHRLGVPTQLMGKIGADPFGQLVRSYVGSYDPALTEGLIVSDSDTSYTVIVSPPGSDRRFLHHAGANDTFCADDVRYDVVAQAALFHFGYPPLMKRMYEDGGVELEQVMRRAKATGVTTSLDMTFPDLSSTGQVDWASILRAAMPYTDLFLPSIEEMLFSIRRAEYEQMYQRAPGNDILPLVTPELLNDLSGELLDWGAKIVLLKLGHRGAYLRTASTEAIAGIGKAAPTRPAQWGSRELWAPCFQANWVGNTGAGDATIAGFLASLLRDLPAEQALTTAVAVGACNVEAADATSGIRTWEETRQRLAGPWPRREMALDSPGWRFDPQSQIWMRP